MVGDYQFPIWLGETPDLRIVRFWMPGCYPLTAAIGSEAVTLERIIEETLTARASERLSRLIARDGAGSMEHKKQEDYF